MSTIKGAFHSAIGRLRNQDRKKVVAGRGSRNFSAARSSFHHGGDDVRSDFRFEVHSDPHLSERQRRGLNATSGEAVTR